MSKRVPAAEAKQDKPFSLKLDLPADIRRAFRIACADLDMTHSDLVARAITEYLRRTGRIAKDAA